MQWSYSSMSWYRCIIQEYTAQHIPGVFGWCSGATCLLLLDLSMMKLSTGSAADIRGLQWPGSVTSVLTVWSITDLCLLVAAENLARYSLLKPALVKRPSTFQNTILQPKAFTYSCIMPQTFVGSLCFNIYRVHSYDGLSSVFKCNYIILHTVNIRSQISIMLWL